MKNFKHSALLAISFALMIVAEISTSTSTACMWYEPECPEELLK